MISVVSVKDKEKIHNLEVKTDELQQEVDSLKSYYNGMVFVDGQWVDEDDWSQRLSE